MVLPDTYTGNLFSNEAANLSWQFWRLYTLVAHYLACLVGDLYRSPIPKPQGGQRPDTPTLFTIVIAAVRRLIIGRLSVLALLFPRASERRSHPCVTFRKDFLVPASMAINQD